MKTKLLSVLSVLSMTTMAATLTLSVNDAARGSVAGDGEADAAGVVSASAVAAEGYGFVCWQGSLPVEVDAASAEISFALAEDTALTAVFGKVYDVAADGAGAYSSVSNAVMAALDAEDGNGVGVVRLAPGEYAFDGEVPVSGGAVIALCGDVSDGEEVLLTVTEDAAGTRNRLFNVAGSTIFFRDLVVTNCGFNVDAGKNGMVFYSTSSSLDFRRCRFDSNKNTKEFAGSIAGGVIYASGGSLYIADSIFTNNCIISTKSNGGNPSGGALHVGGSATVRIDDCDFINNEVQWHYWSAYGGACSFGDSDVKITRSHFKSNRIKNSYPTRSDKECGGIDIYAAGSTTLSIADCLFEGGYLTGSKLLQDSTSPVRGGSIWANGSKVKTYIERTVFNGVGTENTTWKAGALTLSGNSSAYLTNVLSTACGGNHVTIYQGKLDALNCTFANSDAEASTPGAAVAIYKGSVAVKNSILWNNAGDDLVNLDPTADTVPAVTASFDGCIVETTVPTATENKVGADYDPLFVDSVYCHPLSKGGYYANGWFDDGAWVYDSSVQMSPAVDGALEDIDYSHEVQPNGLVANIGYDANTSVASKSVVDDDEPIVDEGKVVVYAYPAVSVGGIDATVRGQLASDGVSGSAGAAVSVYVVWDKSDKGTDGISAWGKNKKVGDFTEWESFDVVIDELETMAFYRFVAVDGDDAVLDWSNVEGFYLARPPQYEEAMVTRIERTSAFFSGKLTDNGGIDSYALLKYWATSEGDGSDVEPISYNDGESIAVGDVAEFAVTGLEPGVNYSYELIFRNSAGDSIAKGAFNTVSLDEQIERYVDVEAQGLADGRSWAGAYGNLQTAIDACSEAGDIIYLKSGEHTVGITTSGAVNNYSIANHQGLIIKGGYLGDGAPGAKEGETVLAPNVYIPESHRGFYINKSVLTLEDITIKGFAASDGYGSGFRADSSTVMVKDCDFTHNGNKNRSNPRGGAIYTSGGTLDIIGCVFSNNCVVSSASGGSAQGGVLHINNTAFTCAESIFRHNYVSGAYHGGIGGAVSISGGSAVISKCSFETNFFYINTTSTSKTFSGGILIASELTRFELNDVSFVGGGFCGINKSVNIRGGAITLSGKSQKTYMRNVAFSQIGDDENGHAYHRADIYIPGGTLYMTNVLVGGTAKKNALEVAGGTVFMENCTIADAQEGYGIYQSGGSLSVTNSIVWGNNSGTFGGTVTNAAFGYCDMEDDAEGALAGEGNISVDPLFVDNIYYHLYSEEGYYDGFFSGGEWTKAKLPEYVGIRMSSALDKGNPESDYSLEPKRNGKRINLGAYGGTEVATKTWRTPPTVIRLE